MIETSAEYLLDRLVALEAKYMDLLMTHGELIHAYEELKVACEARHTDGVEGGGAATCTRSHPHENMSPECERLTVIARQENAAACVLT